MAAGRPLRAPADVFLTSRQSLAGPVTMHSASYGSKSRKVRGLSWPATRSR